MVSAYGLNSITCHGYNIVRTTSENQKNLTLVLNKESNLIVVPEFKPTFDDFKMRFPVEIKGSKAILYKAVHKKGEEYFSDYNCKFTYEVGKKYTHDNDPSTDDSCSYGLHISEKHWAIAFGNDWLDMALLECEVPIKKIVVAKDCDGKVRTSELKIIREVPKKEFYD